MAFIKNLGTLSKRSIDFPVVCFNIILKMVSLVNNLFYDFSGRRLRNGKKRRARKSR